MLRYQNLLLLIFIISLIVYFVTVARGRNRRRGVEIRSQKLFVDIDSKYEKFIEKHVTLTILKNNSIDIDSKKTSEKAMIIIKLIERFLNL